MCITTIYESYVNKMYNFTPSIPVHYCVSVNSDKLRKYQGNLAIMSLGEAECRVKKAIAVNQWSHLANQS